jgi:hypothetical protein
MFVRNNTELFSPGNAHHSHLTRNNNNIFIAPFSHSFYKLSPHYLCSKIYNKLPSNIVQTDTPLSFRLKLKAFLVEKAFYKLSDYLE